MSKYIYLDTAATASSSKFEVADNFANPNSTHAAGRDSFEALEHARETMMTAIGAKRPSEIVFTSGATEANNMAIFGIARATRGRVAVCAIEHESSLMPAQELKNEGFDVDVLSVDKNGLLKNPNFDKETKLVIVQHANTEIGTIQNIKSIAEEAHKVGAYLHSDMVGSFGRIPVNVEDMGVDSASFSGHKIGTPKGIGMLYLRSNTPFKPLIYGGGQERGLRGGTQNVALAVSQEKAASYALKDMAELESHYKKMKQYLLEEISNIKGVRPTINNDSSLSNICHLVFKNKESETLILQYGKYGIVVSGGPACSSDDKLPSHVLREIGVSQDEIYGAIRLSFGLDTTIDDIKAFIKATKEIQK